MASNAIAACQGCGNKIMGMKYTHNGKFYCYACYQKLQDALIEQEQQKQNLYNYIKTLFGITELPAEVLSYIDRESANGKKLKGMELTLKYYYEIEGHQTAAVSNIIYVIRDQYEVAKQYIINNKKVQEYNANVDLAVPAVTVKLTKKDLEVCPRHAGCKIEDL